MKRQCTIHDVSDLLGISADAIRLYEKEGLVEPLRNPENGYRYYEPKQIHRIMGISLYRQLDISISEIKELFAVSSFDEMSDSYASLIDQNEREILRLQKKTEKLRFMKEHFDALNEGSNSCMVKTLPDCFVLYYQDIHFPNARELKKIITSPVFSFGNFCYLLHLGPDGSSKPDALQFIVRKPMMDICPWNIDNVTFPTIEQKSCLYTVSRSLAVDSPHWNFDGLLSYAREHHLTCESYAYAFYVYSLCQRQTIIDYYEIFLPIVEK